MSKSKKKLSLSDICKHILMVCGVITALTGTVGGIMDTFGGRGDKGGSEGDTIHNNTIIIEQRIVGGGGRAHISKSVDIDVGGEVGAASGDMPAEAEAEATEADFPAPEYITMSGAPEVSWTVMIKNIWGWMLGAGFSVVIGIIGLGWWGKRKECSRESTCSR